MTKNHMGQELEQPERRLQDITIDWSRLRDPFPDKDLEWKVQSAGWDQNGNPWARIVPFVTARAIMDRLDEVVGPDRWTDSYKQWQQSKHGEPAVLCGLSILVGSEWLTKWDAAAETDVEPTKGGISDALKRAAVHWGIGRWLYSLEIGFAETQVKKPRKEVIDHWRSGSALKDKRKKDSRAYFWWMVPSLDGSPRPRPEPERVTNEPDDRGPAQKMVDFARGLQDLESANKARVQIGDSPKFEALEVSDRRRVWAVLMRQMVRLAMDKDQLEGVLDLLRKDKTSGLLLPEQFSEIAADLEGKLSVVSS